MAFGFRKTATAVKNPVREIDYYYYYYYYYCCCCVVKAWTKYSFDIKFNLPEVPQYIEKLSFLLFFIYKKCIMCYLLINSTSHIVLNALTNL